MMPWFSLDADVSSSLSDRTLSSERGCIRIHIVASRESWRCRHLVPKAERILSDAMFGAAFVRGA